MRTYSELKELSSFIERFRYLRLDGIPGDLTFGNERYLNQVLYSSPEWKRIRRDVIVRDNGCDLGVEGFEIGHGILIHHINPITVDDILERRSCLFDMENLICTCKRTHNAIHYGDEHILVGEPILRAPNDTCPWRQDER